MDRIEVGGADEWRSWLEVNHSKSGGTWLTFRRKGHSGPSISYDEAVDEALALGWIDSVIKKIDDVTYVRKFTPRRPGSIWSRLNIDRVGRLKREGRMTKWGLEAFRARSEQISQLERINKLGIRTPKDLEDALRKNPRAWRNFQGFAPSHRKRYLIWINGAKKPQTRKKRIGEAVSLIAGNVRALLK